MILFLRKIVAYIVRFLFPAKIHGKENIPAGGVMLVSNHFSMLDPLYLISAYGKKDIFFLSKKEATDAKFLGFGKALIKAGAVPVDREKPSIESMMKCIKILKEDHKLCLYPEGTRNKTKTNELQPIKAGAAIFAIKARKPLQPVMMSRKCGLFRRIHVFIGKPIELTDFYDKKLTPEVNDELNDFIKNQMVNLLNEGLEKLNKKNKKSCK